VLFLEVIVSKKLILCTMLVAMVAVLVHGLVLLAQTVTQPGRYISSAQWKKDLDESKPALGMVAGQTATIVPNLVIRRRLAGPNNASRRDHAGPEGPHGGNQGRRVARRQSG
jgi:hypothetical protein